ncbi:OsmC family protein [Curtobacterium sp. 9128]|uniref:OsmC family protein n=1 Tax=Curtobacterium sp. 9128 TaxID=1793722 RepID=UPI0011A48608|nr:OsmC family protein [Curtobacterium sp. 9128]
MHDHTYEVRVRWTGDRGTGTSGYRAYGRDHVVTAAGKHDVHGSADPTFRGDHDRWNPEEMLTAALAQCHMLSYLHVAVTQGFTVLAYEDRATASLNLNRDGSGEVTEVTLHPVVTIAEADRVDDAEAAHTTANALCFIARSVAFPVHHEPTTVIGEPTTVTGERSAPATGLGADSSASAAG